ncbi:MAG: hypothetical protein H5U40_13630, partial [Polyangiaceae bacterium]|nr:hypothetical protein [Polyangiaceae bacterium]
ATVVTVQFWLLLHDAVTVTQAKRVYGPIAAGGVAGALLGALFARGLVEWAEPKHLLLLSAVLWYAAAALPRHLVFDDASPRDAVEGASRSGRADVLLLRGYMRRLLALVVIATTTVTAIDYVFKSQAAAAMPAEELASFFATFYVGVNAIALVVQLFISGALVRRVGVGRALTLMPTLLLGFAALFVWAPGIGPAMLLRGTDGSMRHSLHRTGLEILYLPLAGEVRSRIKAVVDGLGHRGGQALASVLMLAITAVGLEMRDLGFILVALLIAWLVALARIRSTYLDLFRASLEPAPAEAPPPSELDLRSLETLFASLNSDNERVVLTAIDLLEAHGRSGILPHILLRHRSERVVLRTLDVLSRERVEGFEGEASELLESRHPSLRAAGLRALLAMGKDARLLEAMSRDSSPAVRATA